MFETERLILRKIIKEDFEELHRLFRDPEVMQYVADIKAEKDTIDWISIIQKSYWNKGYATEAAKAAFTLDASALKPSDFCNDRVVSLL